MPNYEIKQKTDTNNTLQDIVISANSIEKDTTITQNSTKPITSGAVYTALSQIDVSNKMDKTNPTGTGSLSLNRKANTTIGTQSVALGYNGTASAARAVAVGSSTTASEISAFAEGNSTLASGGSSHAEGDSTKAQALAAHAEGTQTEANGTYSHAEGYKSKATNSAAHAEGSNTLASKPNSHAEGYYTTASGDQAHAEGHTTTASGDNSHAEGYQTLASSAYQHVFGTYNVDDAQNTYIEIVGNGNSNTRSNARTLDWNGNEAIAGNMTINKTTLANQASSAISVNLPSSAGTLALTTDIPTIPTNVSAFTNDSGYLVGTKYNANNPSVFCGYNAEENANSDYQMAFKNNNDAYGFCWSKFANRTNSAMTPSQCTYNGFFYVSSTTASLSGADSNPFLASGLHTSQNDFRILTTAYSDQWLQQIATDFRSEYVFVRRRENGTWQAWTKIAPISLPSYSTSATGDTLVMRDSNGDITGRYVYAGWFQTTATTDNANWTDVFVNSNGWLYKRAKASFISDLGISVPTYIASQTTTATATATGTKSVAFGQATASGNYSVAIGGNASMGGSGTDVQALAEGSIAIGGMAYAAGDSNNQYGGIAIGAQSAAGSYSVAIGSYAASRNGATYYSKATCIGYSAGGRYSGADCVNIGYGANGPGVVIGSGACSNSKSSYSATSVVIGYGALGYTGNSYSTRIACGYTSSGRNLMLGAGNTAYTYMNAAGSSWSSASDIRDKTDIEYIDHSLDFIMKLKPITYVMNTRESYLIKDEKEMPILDENGKQQYDVEAHERGDKKKHRRFAGLSAQATYQAMIECYDNNDNYAQIVDDNKYDNPDDEYIQQYCMSYERLVPFLIKAIQEQQEQIDELKQQVESKE